MSRALPKYHKRRVAFVGGAAAVALSGTVIAGFALAGESGQGAEPVRTLAGPGTISCPDVTGELPAVPASAQAEVDRTLAQLQTQIAEANQRLADTVGQGGPNFVQNAILGPLKDKRAAALDRIAISIGRTAQKPQGLQAFATCTLNAGGAQATPAPSRTAGAGQGNGNAGNGQNNGGGNGNAGNTGAGTISCPDVTGEFPAVPASAQAEVDRTLAQLQTQIAEANQRLADTVGQGGPNFVQNAILGPLKDKRVAALNRIETAIGRAAAKPDGLEAFAACTLTR